MRTVKIEMDFDVKMLLTWIALALTLQNCSAGLTKHGEATWKPLHVEVHGKEYGDPVRVKEVK